MFSRRNEMRNDLGCGQQQFLTLNLRKPATTLTRIWQLKKMCGNKLRDDHGEQNQLWYRFYKSVQKRPAIEACAG
jgi:hypothetical protein